jgi:hypothetical protein
LRIGIARAQLLDEINRIADLAEALPETSSDAVSSK